MLKILAPPLQEEREYIREGITELKKNVVET